MSARLRIALAAVAAITVLIFTFVVVDPLLRGPPVAILLYFLPTLIALMRWHGSAPATIKVNVFAGWTIVGWVIALTWACWHKSLKSAIVGPAVAGVAFWVLCMTVGAMLRPA